jgi:hypothetical protein
MYRTVFLQAWSDRVAANAVLLLLLLLPLLPRLHTSALTPHMSLYSCHRVHWLVMAAEVVAIPSPSPALQAEGVVMVASQQWETC